MRRTPSRHRPSTKPSSTYSKKRALTPGTDTKPSTLLPTNTACPSLRPQRFRKEMDILDVWFESGASWHAVLEHDPNSTFPADLYTEGGDQHRGWFHPRFSSPSASRDHAPYKMVATSGWTLDEQGRAFSKSIGNGVDPVDIAKRLGGEIIRLWVASVDFREDVAASENIMQRVSDNYRKLRNTLRFLLSNLSRLRPRHQHVDFAQMEPLDQYILARIAELNDNVREAYDAFEFHRAYHALNEFVNTDLSALYLDVLKDRLYTFAPNAPRAAAAHKPRSGTSPKPSPASSRPSSASPPTRSGNLLPSVDEPRNQCPPRALPRHRRHRSGNVKHIYDDWNTFSLSATKLPSRTLEEARTGKEIGKALDGSVVFDWSNSLASETPALLERYESVSPRTFRRLPGRTCTRRTEGTVTGASDVNASPPTGCKCERCWRYTDDVGKTPTTPPSASAAPTPSPPSTTHPTPAKERRPKPDVLQLQYPATEFDTMSTSQATPQRDYRIPLLILAALVVLIDRITKCIVVAPPSPGQTHPSSTASSASPHVHNTGAAFSFFADSVSPVAVRNGLIAFSIIAVIILVRHALARRPRVLPHLRRPRPHPGRSLRQPLRPHPLPLRHRLPRSPHHPLPLARLQRSRHPASSSEPASSSSKSSAPNRSSSRSPYTLIPTSPAPHE